MKSGTKKNQVDSSSLFLCVLFLLSIGRRTIKRDATWWSWQNQSAQNPERFHEWCKETKFQECAEICPTGQTGIAHRSDRLDLSQSKSGHHRTCPGPNPNLPIQRVSFRECPEPVGGHPTGLTGMMDRSDRSGLTAQRLVFQKHYKRASTPSLVCCWFLTICITFQQPLELSPSTLCEIQVLCGGFLVWVESFVCEPLEFKPWALWAASSTREAFVTLGGEAS